MLLDFFLRFPGGRAKALTFSYDDGVEEDARLADIFNRNGLKGTFNLNGGLFRDEGNPWPEGTAVRRMTARQALRTFGGTAHEIGFHGLTHAYWEQMPPVRVAQEILEDRRRLEGMFHTLVRGGAYPYGTWNAQTVETLRACGAAYCRTTASTGGFDVPQDWLLLPPTCHHGDPRLEELTARFLSDPAERRPLLFYLWGHSFEFEREGNWALMERLAERLGGREDICYATNGELCDYVAAFRALRMSCDGRLVENPTATDVWYACRGRTGCVPAGQRVELEG